MRAKTRDYLEKAQGKAREASAPEWPKCAASEAKEYALAGALDAARALAYEIFGEPFEAREVNDVGIVAKLAHVPGLASSLKCVDLTPETGAAMALGRIPENRHDWYALTREECLQRSSAFVDWVKELLTRSQDGVGSTA
jgi:hypothetical protein